MSYMRDPSYAFVSQTPGNSFLEIAVGQGGGGRGSARIPLEDFDALVVMRYAEMQAGKFRDSTGFSQPLDGEPFGELVMAFEMKVAMAQQGNGGADALCRKYSIEGMVDRLVREVEEAKEKR